MSEHGERDPTSERAPPGDRDALLRALEELRALDIEKRRAPRAGSRFDEIARRIEVKAREVFRLAEATEDRRPDSVPDEAASADGPHRPGQH